MGWVMGDARDDTKGAGKWGTRQIREAVREDVLVKFSRPQRHNEPVVVGRSPRPAD